MGVNRRLARRIVALGVWVAGILVFAVLFWWNLKESNRDLEDALMTEAGRTASQFANLLSLGGWGTDDAALMAAMAAIMEDERISAVRVETLAGEEKGLGRNYLWEPVPWDGDVGENCVQGMTLLRFGNQIVGNVTVWVSDRLTAEDNSEILRREWWRFGVFFLLWTTALFLVLWQWGDFRRMRRLVGSGNDDAVLDQFVLAAPMGTDVCDRREIVDQDLARRYQAGSSEAWLVTAGMFRQTFARGPALLVALYRRHDFAGLRHLGKIIEQAAPCVGACKLGRDAAGLQQALEAPDNPSLGLLVERCRKSLEEVLDALNGEKPWRG